MTRSSHLPIDLDTWRGTTWDFKLLDKKISVDKKDKNGQKYKNGQKWTRMRGNVHVILLRDIFPVHPRDSATSRAPFDEQRPRLTRRLLKQPARWRAVTALTRGPSCHIRNSSLVPRILLGLYTDIFVIHCESIPKTGANIQTYRQTNGATVLIY